MKKAFRKSGVVLLLVIAVIISIGVTAFAETEENNTIVVVENIKTKNQTKGVLISWDKQEDADAYKIFRKEKGKEKVEIAHISEKETNTFLDTTVSNCVKYNYTVSVVKGDITGEESEKTEIMFVKTPVLKKAVNGKGYITVSWKAVSGVSKYRVYKKTGNSDWDYIKTVNSPNTSFKDEKVVNGKTYLYTVRAIKDDFGSGIDEKGVKGKYVSVPENIKIKNTDNKLSVTWNKVKNVKQYNVYRKDTNNTTWKLVAKTTSNKYVDRYVKNGIVYRYTVRAVGKNDGLSAYISGEKLVALKAPGVKLICTSDGIRIKWYEMATATGYRVYKKAPGDSKWELLAKVSGNTNTYKLDKSVTKGKKYIYAVRQVRGNTLGSYNLEGISTKFNPAPTITLHHSPKGILVEWNKAAVGKNYEIERKTESNKTWKKIATVKGLSKVKYTDSKARYGEMNYYRIKVTDSNLLTYSESIYGIDPKKPVVALTYDDGPYTSATNRILDTLEKYDARATFFVVGSRVNEYADCIRREAAMGCEIANHTYNHTILTSASDYVIRNEIERTNNAVKNITGITPTLVRAPGGSVNSRVLSVVDYPLVNWSVDTLDWKNSSGVVSIVKRNVRDGSIVLMHDLYNSTASATETIVPWLVSQGYQLVTVTELMEIKGIDMKAGNLYTCGY